MRSGLFLLLAAHGVEQPHEGNGKGNHRDDMAWDVGEIRHDDEADGEDTEAEEPGREHGSERGQCEVCKQAAALVRAALVPGARRLHDSRNLDAQDAQGADELAFCHRDGGKQQRLAQWVFFRKDVVLAVEAGKLLCKLEAVAG